MSDTTPNCGLVYGRAAGAMKEGMLGYERVDPVRATGEDPVPDSAPSMAKTTGRVRSAVAAPAAPSAAAFVAPPMGTVGRIQRAARNDAGVSTPKFEDRATRIRSSSTRGEDRPLSRRVSTSKVETIQREVVAPKMSGGAKALDVTLDLETGDEPQMGAGTKGNEVIDGIQAVTDLKQTAPKSALGFVRFHVLNADNGGRPVPGNLTSATRSANQHQRWKEFEAKEYQVLPEGEPVTEPTKFEGTVTYHDAKSVVFKSNAWKKQINVNDAHYPKKIEAKIEQDGDVKAEVELNGPGDGLVKMSDTIIPYFSAVGDDGEEIEQGYRPTKKPKGKARHKPY